MLRMSRSTHARPHSRARNPLCVAHGLPGEILHLPLLRVHIYQCVQKRGNFFPPSLRDIVRTKVENYRYRERIETIIRRAIFASVRCGKVDRGHDKSLITSIYISCICRNYSRCSYNRERIRERGIFTRKILQRTEKIDRALRA